MYAIRRLKFLSRIAAWTSLRNIAAMRNRYHGKSAVILCNGPSLNDVPLEHLEAVHTFGLNKINLIFDKTSFRPNFIVAVNPYVIEQNKSFYEETNIPLFLDGWNVRGRLKTMPHHHHLLCYEDGFSTNAARSVSQGGTVTFVALQLAYHMGFSKVALVGCDHHFVQTGQPHTTLHGAAKDKNHFDDRYFASQHWQAPDLAMSERSYQKALEAFVTDGRQLVNASTFSKLEILPRQSLQSFLNEN